MGIREHLEGYRMSLADFRIRSATVNEDYFKHPSTYYVKPFRIADDLFYVGDRRCCVHLLVTHDGLILFDSGMQHTVHLLIQAIWEAGFNPADIKYIVHSHGHYDHFGASNDMRILFGCKTMMSKVDAESLRCNPSRSLLSYNPNPWASIPSTDIELDDGDIIQLGDTCIRCVLVPSHTPGTLAFFFPVTENGNTYRVGYYGGIGFLSVYREFLEEYRLPLSLRQDFLHSLDKVSREEVDIVLGNHPSQNNTLEKMVLLAERGRANNPFIDSSEWGFFISVVKERLHEFIGQGY